MNERFEVRGPYPQKNLVPQRFLRHMLQKTPPPNQIEKFEATLRTPQGGFDRRQQTARMQEQRRGTGALPPRLNPPSALSERNQRPARPIRPPRRPLDDEEVVETLPIRRNTRAQPEPEPMEEEPLVNNRRRRT